ncbi:MAG: MlaD family protein [Pseudorhodobacter sp.]
METRANYILIGAFTLAGFVGILAFFLWFARVELDRQFAYYDVRFTSVSGLARASDVRFAGLPVGQVVDVRLSPDQDGTVLVRIEVRADVPVRTSSVATIESQGVTGVSYVGISAGENTDPLLRTPGSNEIPQIEAGRSMLQSLTEDAPELLEEVLRVVRDISDLLSSENVQRVDNILANLESASEGFAQSLDDFTVVASAISGFAIEISNFNVMLEGLTAKAETLFATANDTVQEIGVLAQAARTTMTTGSEAFAQAATTLRSADLFINEDMKLSADRLNAGLDELRAQMAAISTEATAMLAEFRETGQVATARLTEAEATIKATDALIEELSATLETMDRAAENFDLLVTVDGAELVAEARAALKPISEAANTDLPLLVADIRAATETASRSVTAISESLTGAAGKADDLMDDASRTLSAVTATFTDANETLAAINSALAVGERTLSAAERTFEGADRIINEDVAVITTDLRRTINALDLAIAQVSADIPGVTADLKAASEAARLAFEDVARTVTTSGGPIRDFSTTALPQFSRLARETRDLINNLDQLTRQIQRDPARFFLGGNTPAYRR